MLTKDRGKLLHENWVLQTNRLVDPVLLILKILAWTRIQILVSSSTRWPASDFATQTNHWTKPGPSLSGWLSRKHASA